MDDGELLFVIVGAAVVRFNLPWTDFGRDVMRAAQLFGNVKLIVAEET